MDVQFQGIFMKYPICYTDGVTQRLVDIDFIGMYKDECYAFMARLSGEMCEKLYYCQPDIDFQKDEENEEIVDNMKEEVRGLEEVIDDGEKVDPFDIGDEDEVEVKDD
ncbi:unnamed protein product [Lactuca saligna]|uniref:Uncharacterized protein n=1 Tax=Lactuca saligna TaxID=75948 RepID=A0AA36EMC1_LACSI|nr:unnamed protein product [Lactuca saligna]